MADLRVTLFLMAMTVLLCSSCLAHADCMDVVSSMSPCLDYMNNRTSQLPPSECCLQLMTIVRSQPLCLCIILDGELEAKLGIPIDKNRALALPATCRVQTPPVSECKDGSGMGESPTESPKEMHSSSNHSVHTDDACPGCETGHINDPEKLIPSPPQVLPP